MLAQGESWKESCPCHSLSAFTSDLPRHFIDSPLHIRGRFSWALCLVGQLRTRHNIPDPSTAVVTPWAGVLWEEPSPTYQPLS